MSILIIAVVLALLVGAAEKSDSWPAVRVRHSRPYQAGRRRLVDAANGLRGRTTVLVNGQRSTISTAPVVADPPRTTRRERAAAITYQPPAAPSASAAAAPAGSAATVEFFAGLLALVNSSYEKPNDALRQIRALVEGGRQWNLGLTRLHQRMADAGDMRIDPFVSDHVVRAAAFAQAMVLELADSDAAMTALLNMSLAEIQERGLQVPNTR